MLTTILIQGLMPFQSPLLLGVLKFQPVPVESRKAFARLQKLLVTFKPKIHYIYLILWTKKLILSLVVHTFNPCTWETEAVDLWIWDQSGLQSKFQDGVGYTEKPCHKQRKRKKEGKEKEKLIS